MQIDTQFFLDGEELSLEELQNLDPNFTLDDRTLSGYSMLLALPPGVGATIGAVSGETIVIPITWQFEAAAPDVLGPAAQVFTPFWFRNQWMVRLRVWPTRFEVTPKKLTIMPHIAVRLDLTGQWQKLDPPASDPVWEPIYRQSVLNYDDGLYWRKRTPASFDQLEGPAPATGNWQLRVRVDQQGLHRISYDDLAAAGIDGGAIAPTLLQLYEGVQPVAIQVSGEEDGRFDPGDDILFYAAAAKPTYDGSYVYWLMQGETPGKRVSSRSTPPGGALLPGYNGVLHLEEQNIYYSERSNGNGDHWFWATIRPQRNGSGSKSIQFDLLPVNWGPVDATLRLRLMGYEPGVTDVRVSINGYEADSFRVTDQQYVLREVKFPHFMLNNGPNEGVITVERVGSQTNTVVLDWIEVGYVRQLAASGNRLHFKMNWPGVWRTLLDGFDEMPVVWDVSDPTQPVMIESVQNEISDQGVNRYGFTSDSADLPIYEAATTTAMLRPDLEVVSSSSSLLDTNMQADHIIIAPDELLGAAKRLAAHRNSQGLRSIVIPLPEIFDTFNAGNADPEAIRAFINYTLTNWQTPAPAYLLLFGDGHYDPRHYQTVTPIRVPVALRDVDPWLREVADENYFAAVIGDDAVADIMMGRLPVQTPGDAERLVDKLIRFDQLSSEDAWLSHTLVVADNPDTAGDFHALADAAAQLIRSRLTPDKFYLGRTHSTADAMRPDMLNAWGLGPPIINYVGHGQPDAWAGENILNRSHLPGLQNLDRPGILLAMASLTGVFYNPNIQSMQEDMLLLPDGRGVAGYVASTGYGLSAGNALVNEGFLNAMSFDLAHCMGEAMLYGKLNLYTNTYSYSEFLVQLFTLFGDPASQLPDLPRQNAFYMPLYSR
ncbi:MAG: hypothetical protein J5I90_05895 [Caldilineales bacterium]|nr:hypothetical protein [Caldilineales bacterium]